MVYSVCVSGTKRTMISWHKRIGEFENSRGNMRWLLFYVIMFVFYLIDKLFQWRSWQGSGRMTFRTWVRAPGPHTFHIIFSKRYSCAGITLWTMMHLQNQSVHLANEINLRVMIWRAWWTLVNAYTCWHKSQPGFAKDGPKLLKKNLQIRGRTP